MGFFQKLRNLFVKEDNSTNTDNTTNTDNSIKTNNSKRVKQVAKGNNNNFGTQKNITKNITNHFSATYTEDDYNEIFVLKMRWNHLVPHKIIKKQDAVDCFNVLVPSEEDFLQTDDILELSDSCDKYHGLYLRFRHNPTICNLMIESLKINTDKSNMDLIVNRSVIGLLDTDKAFVLNHKDLYESNGAIEIEISYEKENKRYKQSFSFEAKNNSSEFIIRQYSQPKLIKNKE